MDTPHTSAPRSRRTFSDLHLLLLSIALGFCISFGGSLLLADQLTMSARRAPAEPDLVWARAAPSRTSLRCTARLHEQAGAVAVARGWNCVPDLDDG